MGILARLLLGPPRPAREIEDLVVDLEHLTVAGLGYGDHPELLARRLGPPNNLRRRAHWLDYAHLGFSFGLDERQRVESWSLWTGKEGYGGRWKPGGDRAPSEAEVIAALGEPTGREVDDEEVMLEWDGRLPRAYVGVDFALDGTLSWVAVDYVG